MSILSERIKKERENLGMTREDLAQKIGVSYSAIAMYEQGNREPNRELSIKLCEIFNCSLDYLMGLTSYKNPKEDLEKELYLLNLTEEEFNKMVYILLDENDGSIEDVLRTSSKLAVACEKCLNLIIDYEKDGSNSLYEHIPKLTNLIKTLDKSKIIHNYQNNININKQYYMCPVYGRISAGQPNWAEECIEGRLPVDPELMNIVDPEECFFLKVNGESMNQLIKNGSFALIRKADFVENGEIAVVLINHDEATLKKFSKQGDVIVLEPMSNDPSFTTQIYNKDTEIKVIGKYLGKMEMK